MQGSLPSSADFISAAREVSNWSPRSLPVAAPKLNLEVTLRQKVSCIQQAMRNFHRLRGCNVQREYSKHHWFSRQTTKQEHISQKDSLEIECTTLNHTAMDCAPKETGAGG